VNIKRNFEMSNLILIAGMSGVGKTTLIEKIKQGEYPVLSDQLGMCDTSSWSDHQAYQAVNMDLSNVGNLIVHYDIHARFSERTRMFDYCEELFCNFECINVVTLIASQEVLVERQKGRLYRKIALYFKYLFKSSDEELYKKVTVSEIFRILKKVRAYKKGISHQRDDRWLTYISQLSVDNHYVINCSEPYATETYMADKLSSH